MRNKSFLDRLVSQWPAKALSLAAAILLFLFHNYSTLSERFITIPLKVVFTEGYINGQPIPRRVRVVVRGKEKNLSNFSETDIEAVADFSSYKTEGAARVPVHIRRKTGVEDGAIMQIRVEPVEIVTTLERKATKRIEVLPVFKGSPASGYELTQYYLSPSLVQVEGPASLIERTYTISTDPIDLTGKKENFSMQIRLHRENPLLNFLGGEVVEFRGFIQETTLLKTIEGVSIVALDLRPDLKLSEPLPKGTLRVQGPQNLLETLESDQVRLLVNCKNLDRPGTYTLPVLTDIPSNLLVLRFEPTEVKVVVERGE
ncbi:MAG: CdaR family protein [Spirochaetales bacterium]